MKVTTYSPEPLLRHPGLLFREMLESLWAGRELAWRLAIRNISAMYRQTALGYVWAFLPPLLAAFTFIILRRGGILETGDLGVPYVAWVLIGTSLWQVFADSINAPMRQVSQAKSMLAKINFPREALIVAGVLETLFNFVIRLVIFVAVFAWFRIVPGWEILLLPFALMVLIVLGTMIGVLLTPPAVLYQDIEKGIPVLLPFLMILSGAVVPAPKEGLTAQLLQLNPIYPVLDTCRSLLIGQHPAMWMETLLVAAASLVLLLFGWVLYRLAMPHLIARLGG